MVTVAETALERELSAQIMRAGARPKIESLSAASTLVGDRVAELGPGAILGERAVLEGGRRTATLRAVTRAKVAVARSDQIDPTALAEVSRGHRREEG